MRSATAQAWGLDFPVITINDMVRAQALLLDALGIGKLFAVMGGSMGGMQTLAWATNYPERIFAAIPIATAARHSSQNIAFHEVGRQAIVADPAILLCDEPTGDLDRATADEILGLLQQLNRQHNKTIVMVTHDPKAADHASRQLAMDKGQLIERAVVTA